MSERGDADDLRRVLAFERGIREGSATRLERFPYGVAAFQEEFPLSYDHNLLLLDMSPTASPPRRWRPGRTASRGTRGPGTAS